MPTSPRRKIHRINNAFRQNRNILHRADVGIGPYDILLSQSQAAHGGFLLSLSTSLSLRASDRVTGVAIRPLAMTVILGSFLRRKRYPLAKL